MPNFPKPTFAYSYNANAEIQRLRAHKAGGPCFIMASRASVSRSRWGGVEGPMFMSGKGRLHTVADSAKPAAQVIRPPATVLVLHIVPPTIWQSYSFAPEWFADALHEARTGTEHHARRREIVFVVCCAESYLVEWVRDEVLRRDRRDMAPYFPARPRRGICERWKSVVKRAHAEGRLSSLPDFTSSPWRDFVDLVEARNGLVHGSASHPDPPARPHGRNPHPSKTFLDTLRPGHAVRGVAALIRQLHAAAQTDPPNWLVEP